MVLKADQERLQTLLREAIPMMCKNGVQYKTDFCIEALIGITVDKNDVFLVSINETFKNERVDSSVDKVEDQPASPKSPRSPRSRKRRRSRDYESKRQKTDASPSHIPTSDTEDSRLSAEIDTKENIVLNSSVRDRLDYDDGANSESAQSSERQVQSDSSFMRQSDSAFMKQSDSDNIEDDEIVVIKEEPGDMFAGMQFPDSGGGEGGGVPQSHTDVVSHTFSPSQHNQNVTQPQMLSFAGTDQDVKPQLRPVNEFKCARDMKKKIDNCFVCLVCGYKSVYGSNVHRHIMGLHMQAARHACSKCGENFRWNTTREKHELSCCELPKLGEHQ